ncbi:MAG: AraC family transcriptional regulator, partial [Spirochaetaceae bacterium]|nr:AraC family transcriptional regulator [Spirochaetaceae bacterium]
PADPKIRKDRSGRNEHIERALILMGKAVREKLSIDVLAGKLGLSSEHFIRLFHQKLGMSPLQYFMRLKIEGASAILVDTHLKIGAVSEHFGFETPFHFSRIFKKCTGLSPLEYRRTYIRVVEEKPFNNTAYEADFFV